jgi:hypothetical protein
MASVSWNTACRFARVGMQVIAQSMATVSTALARARDTNDVAAQLSAMAEAVLVLQVTECGLLTPDCGPGVCASSAEGATCDCSGTGFTGPRCDSPVPSPSTSPSVSPSPRVGATLSVSPAPAPATSPIPIGRWTLLCPSRFGGVGSDRAECSGHGACVLPVARCQGADSDCIPACRFVMKFDAPSAEPFPPPQRTWESHPKTSVSILPDHHWHALTSADLELLQYSLMWLFSLALGGRGMVCHHH